MRKETINLLTIYMLAGALVNAITVWVVYSLNTTRVEELITIVAVNACYISVARLVAMKHEMICSIKAPVHQSHVRAEKAHHSQ